MKLLGNNFYYTYGTCFWFSTSCHFLDNWLTNVSRSWHFFVNRFFWAVTLWPVEATPSALINPNRLENKNYCLEIKLIRFFTYFRLRFRLKIKLNLAVGRSRIPLTVIVVKFSQSVLDLLQRFKDSRFVSTIPDFEESWLKEFLSVINKTAEALYLDPEELLSKENFMSQLLQFLQVLLFSYSDLITKMLLLLFTEHNYMIIW